VVAFEKRILSAGIIVATLNPAASRTDLGFLGAISTPNLRGSGMEKNEPEGRHSPAVMELARLLYETMEHLDPGSGGGSSWGELPDRDVEFYALSVEALIEARSVVQRALADDDMIFG
jgi:hypothetical protein